MNINRKPTLSMIKHAAQTIAEKLHPKKINLFGSYAYGRPNRDSDVDLLIIKDGKKKRLLAPDTYEYACFHCQQAAEKYLKAFLTLHRHYFSKTHDLKKLQKLAIPFDMKIAIFTDNLQLLNLYSVDIRYPGASATKQEAKAAFRAATKLRFHLRNSILKALKIKTKKRIKK
ncbi:MAG: HEPN domain-containing protein [Elusimicrobia bacterium]|nr:HEPN domain-containing protein [Elusimicrobiota bacterium]